MVFYKCFVGGFGLLFGSIGLFSSFILLYEQEYGYFLGYTFMSIALLIFGLNVIRFKKIDAKLEQVLSKIHYVISPPINKFWNIIGAAISNIFLLIILVIISVPVLWVIYKVALLIGPIPVSILIGAMIIATAIKK